MFSQYFRTTVCKFPVIQKSYEFVVNLSKDRQVADTNEIQRALEEWLCHEIQGGQLREIPRDLHRQRCKSTPCNNQDAVRCTNFHNIAFPLNLLHPEANEMHLVNETIVGSGQIYHYFKQRENKEFMA